VKLSSNIYFYYSVPQCIYYSLPHPVHTSGEVTVFGAMCFFVSTIAGMVQYGLTSHSTHYRSFRRRYYGLYDPTNSVIALKDNG